jgi:Holliday junction resolvase
VNAKAKGTRAEHRSIRLLEAAGYACTRAAASLGVWDIIGVGSTDVVPVQVKTRDTEYDRMVYNADRMLRCGVVTPGTARGI